MSRPPSDPNLLFGRHAIRAALLNPDRRFRALWCLPDLAADLTAMIAERPAEGMPVPQPEVRDRMELDTLLPEGSVHQGMAARVEPLPEVSIEEILMQIADDPKALLVVLDQVTDPHNVGAILRSTAAFGGAALVMQDRHGPPTTGVLAKTASGALDVVPVVRVTNLARALDAMKAAGFWCVGLAEQTDTTLADADLSGRTALILGAEGDGLRRLTRETCDMLVKLPTVEPIGSLNVSAAAAVALYQARVIR